MKWAWFWFGCVALPCLGCDSDEAKQPMARGDAALHDVDAAMAHDGGAADPPATEVDAGTDAADEPAPACDCAAAACTDREDCQCRGAQAVCVCRPGVACDEAPPSACSPDPCNGRGICAEEATGAVCVCVEGYAGGDCGSCATGFIARPSTGTCVRPDSLVAEVVEPFGDNCDVGGTAMLIGLDLDDDGTLDADEVVERRYDCAARKVFEGNVTLTNQAEVDALLGVNEITGSLRIETSDVQDLSPLSGLIEVGALDVWNNGQLVTLEALDRLRAVHGALQIAFNATLVEADFASLERIDGRLEVTANDALTELDGFPKLQRVSAIWIYYTSVLEQIDGFESLRTITDDIQIHHNGSLLRMAGFDALQSLGGDITIYGNSLVEIAGFDALADAQSVSITNNTVLTTVTALSGLRTLRGSLSITGHRDLALLDAFPSLSSVDMDIVIEGNPSLATLRGFGALEHAGGLLLTDLPALKQVGAFGGLTRLSTVAVERTGLTTFDLPKVSRLSQLTIIDNPELTTLDNAFAALTDAGQGVLDPSCCASLTIRNNPKLTTVDVFRSLETADVIWLGALPATQITGLESLTQVYQIRIEGMDSLTALPALPALKMISLRLDDDDALTDLSGLESVEMVELFVNGNASMTTLDGYPGALTNLTVTSNPSLPTCLAQQFATATGATSVTITGNRAGACN